jgi:hypothetical protein
VLLAVLLVTAVAVVLLTEDEFLDAEDVFPEVVILDEENRPDFVFHESARSYDLSLNRFVDRFARVCMEGRYSDFRLMLSSRSGGPIVARRFESMFNALKQVRILSLEKHVIDPERLPDFPGFDGVIYVMVAEYDLEDYAVLGHEPTERRQLAIAKENGVWRIGPIPSDLLALRQRGVAAATTRPGTGDVSGTGEESGLPEPVKTSANRPARLGS